MLDSNYFPLFGLNSKLFSNYLLLKGLDTKYLPFLGQGSNYLSFCGWILPLFGMDSKCLEPHSNYLPLSGLDSNYFSLSRLDSNVHAHPVPTLAKD